MNISKITLIGLFSLSFFSLNAQIKIQKPSLKINTGSGTQEINFGKDPSGLFTMVSDDPSAVSHRRIAVENLEKLETEYKNASVNYEVISKLIKETERELGYVKQLEPKAKSEKYYERYTPIKEKSDKDLAVYDQVLKSEDQLRNDFKTSLDYKAPSVESYGTDNYSGVKCYCRYNNSSTKSHADYLTSKAEYEKLTAQLIGYKDSETQTVMNNLETCLKNGNKYAIWASKENLTKEITEYNTKSGASEPSKVITRCEKYIAGLRNIEADKSLDLSAEAKTALTEGIKNVTKTKTDLETYISSGAFKKYEAKIHADKIAKVFLPKAVTVNAKLEEGAKAYIKGTEFADYLKGRGDGAVASTVKAVTLTKEQIVVKNDFDLPKYQYHEIWVSYKGADGKCYMTAVYASYTYKGGGTYATVPTWGADAPEEMSCLNVSK
ncbi:MAG: hypothetical protein V4622_02870 [Bacteroidota bacterium]